MTTRKRPTDRPITLVEHEVLWIRNVQRDDQGLVVLTRASATPEPFVQRSTDRHEQKHPAPYIDSDCTERKTEDNPRGMSDLWTWWTRDDRMGPVYGRCPFGKPGDTLWVRETWQAWQGGRGADGDSWEPIPARARSPKDWDDLFTERGRPTVEYRAGGTSNGPWTAARSMPRWASRFTLKIATLELLEGNGVPWTWRIAARLIPQSS